MALAGTALLLLYFCCFAVLSAYSLHRLYLLLLLQRRPPEPLAHPLPAALPRVTVQLPIYNERFVIERLLASVEALEYPRALLDVQILDDSNDGTTQLIAELVTQLRTRGLDISHVRRPQRAGYKAGALASGMRSARGEFILILDADFQPQPSLIMDLLSPMADVHVGMVQARWTHLNRNENALTRAQAILLDAHFLIETAARARAGLFFNFHGTAGLWRRSAIEAAGGWSADTVTEDLDLSYRAQLAGWRFIYCPEIEVPAELPSTLAAFRQQQARWARGTIATARKHLPNILRAPLPWRVRFEAVMHLTCHVIYPATFVVALLAWPVALQQTAALTQIALATSIILSTRIYFRAAARMAGTKPPGLREMPHLLMAGLSLTISNTRAVVAGALSRPGSFQRTPKRGTASDSVVVYAARTSSLMRSLDGGTAAYLMFGTALTAAHGLVGAVPVFALLAYAFAFTAVRG